MSQATLAPPTAESIDRPSSAAPARSLPLDGNPADLLATGRFARLLRQPAEAPVSPAILAKAREQLEFEMAMVPPGDVVRGVNKGGRVEAVTRFVDAYFIDRHTVTNADFARFVAAGGYDNPDLWPAQLWPRVVQFVDQSGYSGPRFWSKGKPARGANNHPVVGVCWFEADAYCRWIGKRLPSGDEWERAGTWPASVDGTVAAVNFPWGNTADPERVNTWIDGPGATVPVDQYAAGSTPNGVYQLIGNVWEWTSDPYRGPSVRNGLQVEFEQSAGEVRGGAFNTYFESQATCRFRSGQPLLFRGDNVGLRCALSIEGLQLQ